MASTAADVGERGFTAWCLALFLAQPGARAIGGESLPVVERRVIASNPAVVHERSVLVLMAAQTRLTEADRLSGAIKEQLATTDALPAPLLREAFGSQEQPIHGAGDA